MAEYRELQARYALTKVLRRVQLGFLRTFIVPSLSKLQDELDETFPYLVRAMHTARSAGAAMAVFRDEEIEDLDLKPTAKSGVLERFLDRAGYAPEEIQDAAQRDVLDLSSRIRAETRDTLKQTLADGVAQGKTLKEVRKDFIREAVKNKEQDGAVVTHADTLVRTQTMMVMNASQVEASRNSPWLAKNLWGYRYAAVGDWRTRPTHEAQDGVTLPEYDPYWKVWTPPNGYNCRCSIIALYRESKIVRPVGHMMPDKGFDFNPADVYGTRK